MLLLHPESTFFMRRIGMVGGLLSVVAVLAMSWWWWQSMSSVSVGNIHESSLTVQAQSSASENVQPQEAVSFEESFTITPELLISQLLAVSISLSNLPVGTELVADQNFLVRSWSVQLGDINEIQPGIVVFYGPELTFDTVHSAVQAVRSTTNGAEITIAVDHEGGLVQRLSGNGFTHLEAWELLCRRTSSVRLAALNASASELQRAGIDMVFGPVVDTAAETNPALESRLCIGAPEVVVLPAQDAIDAYMAHGITPVLKHFPGIGSVQSDLHFSYEPVQIVEREKAVFLELLNKYPEIGVMTAHAGVEQDGGSVPCSLSSECLEQLAAFPQALRITDDLGMIDSYSAHETQAGQSSLAERVRLAILAGNERILLGPGISAVEIHAVIDELAHEYRQQGEFSAVVNALTQE